MYQTKEDIKEREEIYQDILKEAELKRKQHRYIIFKKCCPMCSNYHHNCYELEHKINYGIETYKCKNYIEYKEIIQCQI